MAPNADPIALKATETPNKGQALNRVSTYLAGKSQPHLIVSSRERTDDGSYVYSEKSVPPIPQVLVDKANGKEVTYVYTERTEDGTILHTVMVRIPDTPEIRELIGKWLRNGITRRDPSRNNPLHPSNPTKTISPAVAYGGLNPSCEFGPDEIDPRCIDNEQYFDPDLGHYVLCDIIVCDDEIIGDGPGGGGPNPPDEDCQIACDPGWTGPPDGNGGGPANPSNQLPTNPANGDIFVVIDPNTGDTYDLTFMQEWMSWLTPGLRSMTLNTLVYINIAPPETLPDFGTHARILTIAWTAGIIEPTPFGEIIVGTTSAVIASIYVIEAYSFINNQLAIRKAKNYDRCFGLWELCTSPYNRLTQKPKVLDCWACLNTCQNSISGEWICSSCPLVGICNVNDGSIYE